MLLAWNWFCCITLWHKIITLKFWFTSVISLFLQNLRISCVIPWQFPSFLRISRHGKASNLRNISQRIALVMISCQRVLLKDHPIVEKTLRECRGKWKSFMWVPINSENRSGSCSENCGCPIAQVGTLRELREWPFHSESVSWNWGGPQASDSSYTHS